MTFLHVTHAILNLNNCLAKKIVNFVKLKNQKKLDNLLILEINLKYIVEIKIVLNHKLKLFFQISKLTCYNAYKNKQTAKMDVLNN